MASAFPKATHLSRIESARTRGWQVRVRRAGRAYSRLFSDGVHGGSEPARAAALAWRDDLLAALPPRANPAAHLGTPALRAKAAAKVGRTGVVGLGIAVRTRATGQRVPYVTAHWQEPGGQRRSTGYSVLTHGLRGALRKAARTLREGRGETPSQGQIDYLVRKALPQVEAEVHRLMQNRAQ